MRCCIGSPCRTYLVLRSRDVSPGASPAISSASGFSVPVPVMSGRTGSGGSGKFENFKKFNFFLNKFYICFVLCPACILSVLS
ncbi:unnamed protein product, partial [Staurois parvus]